MFFVMNALSRLCSQKSNFLFVSNLNVLRSVNGRSESGSWSGKNAWKLGALGIATSAAFAAGCGIAIWGPPGRDENDVESRNGEDTYVEHGKLCGTLTRSGRTSLLPTAVYDCSGDKWRASPSRLEVVAFTQDSAMTGMPVLAQIDSKGQYIHYRLFRESTRYRKGKHIKDLSCLNRDLSRVVLIDWNPDAASMQPRNAFIINRWTGDDSDRELIDLVAFLRMIAMSGVKDVRPVLDHYRQFDDPLAAFKEKHEQLMEAQARKKEQERMAAKKKSFGFNSFSGFRR
ncbi:Mitochondrial import inner membrane translocase subunit TIM50 [Taenia crassiceps]|uniref:Mitochondrial import inner membrane translocase subunit TIM50 n=1 Tax=Taenia crassiceps TaxID=6207 RepID=A0ABR4QD40_9CEST